MSLDVGNIHFDPRKSIFGARAMSRYQQAIEFDAPTVERRVGVVVPFDFALDWEYWRYLPEGVALHFTR